MRRVPHESDRRAVLAGIAAAGRKAAEAATAVLNEAGFGTAPLATGQLDALFTALRTGAGDFAA